jgi:signal transduction histidine kinase
MLNFGRNATKFVESGFIRLKATADEDDEITAVVQLAVEDSGKGVPPDKRRDLFQKFQTSLNVLNQGIGVGLC